MCVILHWLIWGEREGVKKGETKCFFPSPYSLLETVPSCRIKIASNEVLVSNFLHLLIPQSPNLQQGDETSLLIIGLMCMAYSPETHQHLVKPHIIDSVITASSKQNEESYAFFR